MTVQIEAETCSLLCLCICNYVQVMKFVILIAIYLVNDCSGMIYMQAVINTNDVSTEYMYTTATSKMSVFHICKINLNVTVKA